MGISIFKASKSDTEQISTSEAFNVWNMLRQRYISMQTSQFLKNFIHDRDLLLLLNKNMNDFQKQIDILESQAKKFRLKLPIRPPAEFKISQQIDEITDKFIFQVVFNDFLGELSGLGRAISSSTTNDGLRTTLVNYFLGHLDNFADWYKYGKLKAWTDIAPAYITHKPVKQEMLSVNEAANIWEHISRRYDNMHQTMFFLTFIHDRDFKLILEQGLIVLKKQIQTLEKISIDLEVPLPERPPAQIEAPVDPEVLEDIYMYRIILKGIQSAIDLHVLAGVQTTRNDNLRKLFLDFLKKELNSFDNFLKFGKVKGWLKIEPVYKGAS